MPWEWGLRKEIQKPVVPGLFANARGGCRVVGPGPEIKCFQRPLENRGAESWQTADGS